MHPVSEIARRPRPFRNRRRGERERGFVLVWFAILIIVMLSVTAFAVDLGHAYLVGQQEQDAADAAALSAATYLPDNCSNANPHALAIASLNGFTDGAANTSVTAVNGAAGGAGCNKAASLLPTQIKVDIKTRVDTWFARAIGIDTLTVSRSSTAEFDPPVQLGSPNSNFGTAPGCVGCFDPHVWANAAGKDNRKVDGNAIFENWCAGSSADNCSGNGQNNSDHDSNGMLFQISNPTLENLNIEMFDPGFVDDGQPSGAKPSCNDGSLYPLCTGDSTLSHQTGGAPAMSTRFTLYPLDNLTNPLGNPPICHITYPGYFSPAAAAAANDVTARGFHKWANLATDAGGCGTLNASSYVLQVQSGDDFGGPTQAGSNMFSVAACSGCGSNQPQNDPNVAVSAITKMSLFTNAVGSQPVFYLARIPSWARSQFLSLSFFDIGDVSTVSGQPIGGALTVVSADAAHSTNNSPVGEFANCLYSHPATRSGFISGQITPWASNPPLTEWASNPNSLQSLGGGCTAPVTVNASASEWNGKWSTWQIQIPSDYSCADADFTKCWVKIQYNYPVGAVLHDATTWTASLSGNPVRLTK